MEREAKKTECSQEIISGIPVALPGKLFARVTETLLVIQGVHFSKMTAFGYAFCIKIYKICSRSSERQNHLGWKRPSTSPVQLST